ncbi:MAG TPA: DUF1501 domain-containing protein [Gemmataceae bacterium]|nr:DUF1501 domain-containing protein [Gemmataceae bacterium]
MRNPALLCPGPLSRRHFLKIGALSLGSLGFGGLLPLRLTAKESESATSEKSVILIWLPGGPPHMETYDMKPDAPTEYRGEFKPIKTSVPGIDICEHLPLHAKIAHKFTLIRSIAHTFADHGGGHKKFLTGRDPLQPVGFVNDYPMVGSMVAKMREGFKRGVPNYVAGADAGRDGIDVFSFGSAYLGPSTHPFMFAGDPSAAGFQVKNLSANPNTAAQLPARLKLMQNFDRVSADVDQSGTMNAIDVMKTKALSLMTTDTARKAFDLSREPMALRERYGIHPWGQRAIMARRLVEHGASFVTMVMENPIPPSKPYPKGVIYNWDSHAVNGHIFDDAKCRLPIYDQAITALIEDLYARGLDKKVLLIVTGEFGRTPRISYAEGRPGRDHWPNAMSVLVCGMGMRTGQVVGATNSKGEHPKERPLTPNDLWATMFHHLGIDYLHTSFLDHSGRPRPILDDGEPIRELL